MEPVAKVRKDVDEKPPSLQATHPEAGERRENWASLVKEFDASALVVFEAGSMTYVILDLTYVILPAGRRLPAPPASSAPAFHIF